MYTFRFYIDNGILPVQFRELRELWEVDKLREMAQEAFDKDNDSRIMIGEAYGIGELRVYLGDDMIGFIREISNEPDRRL